MSTDTAYRYVIFIDDTRTSMVEAWPGVENGQQAWTLHYKDRPETGATWGPPSVGTVTDDLASLRRMLAVGGFTNVEYVE